MSDTIALKKIMITTDFSEFSRYAFRYATILAEKFTAELIIVHVIQPTITPADFAWAVPPPNLSGEFDELAKQSLDRLAKELIPNSIKSRTILTHGSPAREIIETGRKENVDMIIMSTHGLGGLSHVLFGSTTEKVVRKSPCPVLTIRHPEHKFEMP
ncbi:MAG: universal stress protein [Fidelibacterota bacterium]